MDTKTQVSVVKDIEVIKPMFEEYVWVMKKYFAVSDEGEWIKRGMEILDLYRCEPDRRMYVLTTECGAAAGFALINKNFRVISQGQSIAEFYIKPDLQKAGLGKLLATSIFDRHSGIWEVCVTEKNVAGNSFWRRVISSYSGDKYQVNRIDSYDGQVYTFGTA